MTAEGRKTAGRIVVGDKVRVIQWTEGGALQSTTAKLKQNGRPVQVATVTGVSSTIYGAANRRRSTRVYTFQTDLGPVYAAPSQTFGIAE